MGYIFQLVHIGFGLVNFMLLGVGLFCSSFRSVSTCSGGLSCYVWISLILLGILSTLSWGGSEAAFAVQGPSY